MPIHRTFPLRRRISHVAGPDRFDAAAVVLVGGRSSRMGESKAALEWHGSTLVRRTVAVLLRTVGGPVVVVCAPGQVLPDLPAGVDVVEDPAEGLGPLQGIAGGLGAVGTRASTAFVCSTDLPFLHPVFVLRVLRELGPGLDIVLPVARGYAQPLAAAYRTALQSRAAELVAAGRLRPVMLSEGARVLHLNDAALLADETLAALDPDLDSLLNVNRPDEYRIARDRLAPSVTVHRGPQVTLVRAATLAAAAAAIGLRLDATLAVTLGGHPVAGPDVGALPLVAGDVVGFADVAGGGSPARSAGGAIFTTASNPGDPASAPGGRGRGDA